MAEIAGLIRPAGHPATGPSLPLRDLLPGGPGLAWQGRLWSGGTVALGWRGDDPSPQPVPSPGMVCDELTGCVAVCDGRLDDREDLARRVDRPDLADEARQTELLLAAWERLGAGCLDHLVGELACAIWDPRRGTLLCARDPLGLRPLFYSQGSWGFAFASRLEALARVCGRSAINGGYLLRLVSNELDCGAETVFQGVACLPGGYALELDASAGGARVVRYWRPEELAPLRYARPQAYGEHFLELFSKIVGTHCRSKDKVALLLSGGLDSSSIAAVAGAGRVLAISAVFDDPALSACDERGRSTEVARRAGLPHALVKADALVPLGELDRESATFDGPFRGPYDLLLRTLMRHARERGCTVLLNGTGGDHAFEGTLTYLCDLRRSLRFVALLRELRGWGRIFRINRRFLRNWVFAPGPRDGPAIPWIRPEAWRRLRIADRLAESRASVPPSSAFRRERLRTYLTDANGTWMHWFGRLGRENGLELREPFFDRRLVELALRLPRPQILHAGTTKVILREALRDLLPDSVIGYVDRQSFYLFLDKGLRDGGSGLRDWLCLHASRLSDLLDPAILLAEYDHYRAGKNLYRYALWSTLNALLWLEKSGERT